MSTVLARWNGISAEEAAKEILPCCGSRAWASEMAAHRPIRDEAALLAVNDKVCRRLSAADWLEAFRSHPRIGESQAPPSVSTQSAAWSGQEQKSMNAADETIKIALEEENRAYEERFHRIFIVCATGKTPAEMLEILRRRLRNDESTEFQEAAEEQRQITQLRLRKWLQG
jgi:2-oxo-4-hydroxy-4-carboxy-5-ureidoimidazoline decarboxylase